MLVFSASETSAPKGAIRDFVYVVYHTFILPHLINVRIQERTGDGEKSAKGKISESMNIFCAGGGALINEQKGKRFKKSESLKRVGVVK